MITVSAVIPTYNRPESLIRTIRSLAQQNKLPDEVIVIDASQSPTNEDLLKEQFPLLKIKCIKTAPSVCAQRNIGIREASGSFILLCDDDIELREDYILRISEFIKNSEKVSVVSGLVLEKNKDNNWVHEYPVNSVSKLFWKFIFQQTIWYEIKNIKTSFLNRLIYLPILAFYLKRKNTFTLAGWPLITHFGSPVFKTAFYGLGAGMIKKEWLIANPFDETLDKNGIGENYGMALGFPEFPAIHVLTTTSALHHKINKGRLPQHEAYFKRVLALNYFMSKSKTFNLVNKIFLIWSLIGSLIVFTFKRKMAYARVTRKLILNIIRDRSHKTG
ncbi:MAG: glycosyltransferase family 2 protein [Bacteroidetes bacterium]|nr:glycosyltransferase family 2 protein [Bacteroidota bacterium]